MGLRVLLVEDEMTIALMMEDMLADLGHAVVATAMRLAPAIEAASNEDLDLAILDVNLDGVWSYPVAGVLRDRGVPFLFATGYGASGLCLMLSSTLDIFFAVAVYVERGGGRRRFPSVFHDFTPDNMRVGGGVWRRARPAFERR